MYGTIQDHTTKVGCLQEKILSLSGVSSNLNSQAIKFQPPCSQQTVSTQLSNSLDPKQHNLRVSEAEWILQRELNFRSSVDTVDEFGLSTADNNSIWNGCSSYWSHSDSGCYEASLSTCFILGTQPLMRNHRILSLSRLDRLRMCSQNECNGIYAKHMESKQVLRDTDA